MAKQIIQAQHTLAIYGITAVVAVAAGLMFCSWIWNLFLRRHELERATKSLRSEITTKGEEDFSKLTQRTKDEIGKMKKEIEKSVEERMILFDAEKARLFAIASEQMKTWEDAAEWWAEAIEGHAKTGLQSILRVAVDYLHWSLEQCEKLEHDKKEEIKKHLPFVPAILAEEKKQIEVGASLTLLYIISLSAKSALIDPANPETLKPETTS